MKYIGKQIYLLFFFIILFNYLLLFFIILRLMSVNVKEAWCAERTKDEEGPQPMLLNFLMIKLSIPLNVCKLNGSNSMSSQQNNHMPEIYLE
jgi:hypothetical protein